MVAAILSRMFDSPIIQWSAPASATYPPSGTIRHGRREAALAVESPPVDSMARRADFGACAETGQRGR